MASLRILVPCATTNYVKNPSFIVNDITAWNAHGGTTLTRSTTYARFDIASLKVVTTGGANAQGAYYRVSDMPTGPVTVSCYVRGNGKVRIRLIDNPFGAQWASTPITLATDRWQRISVSGRASGTNDVRLYVETVAAQTVTFYVDGAQMEPLDYSTTFVDGRQPDCYWNITESSTSSRPASTRLGGRWVDLAGTCRENDDLYVTTLGGLGMPPVDRQLQSWALAPGSFQQGFKVLDRILTFQFHAKHENFRQRGSPNLSHLHLLREQLIDIIKPDLTSGAQPFLFEYTENRRSLYIWAYYEAGLEGDWDLRNEWRDSFPLRLLAVEPFWFEDNQEISTVGIVEDKSTYFVAGRENGRWNLLNGVNSTVTNLAVGKDGKIYIGGSFSTAYNGPGMTLPVTVNNITYWDGERFSVLGTPPGTNGTLSGIAVAPNGDLYVTGSLTTAGGVACNYVAKWNGTAWSALGTGLGAADGLCIAVAPNGDVYVGGQFHAAGGVTAYHMARWNGVAWYSCGAALGLNNEVQSIAISLDGTKVYISGTFTAEYGGVAGTLSKVAVLDVATNTFSALGTGMNNTVKEIILGEGNSLYACGTFTTASGETVNRIAKWNGNVWQGMNGGANAEVATISASPNGEILAIGLFTIIGGKSIPYLAFWNGTTWVNTDIIPSYGSAPGLAAIAFAKNGNWYFGGNPIGKSRFSKLTTVTNTGTAEAYPVIYFSGSGTIKWIENQTTKSRIYIDLKVLTGEVIYIDFRNASIQSTVRGNLSYAILPGSDFKYFRLAPGDNTIAVFVPDDVGAAMYIYYTPLHWSADATIKREPL